MGLIDFILNLAGLMLWLNWRAVRFTSITTPLGASLLRTLKRAEPGGPKRWLYLLALLGLLVFRTVIYIEVGSALHWTPHLNLAVITLPFRSDLLGRMLLYSFLSFGLTLLVFYFWLILFSVVNPSVANTEPLQKLARLHLGWVERWPLWLKLALVPLSGGLLWLALTPALTKLDILPATASVAHGLQQSVVMGLATFLAWKHLIIGLLLLHVVNSYIYLGDSPVWSFVNTTARSLLAPLRRLPLQTARVDLAPVVGIIVVFLAAEMGSRWLTELYQRLPF